MHTEYSTYLNYVIKEVLTIQVYISAAIIGSIICYLTSNFNVVPYIVPLLVQILVRSHTKFRHRHQNALVELPAQTQDPAFIMDMKGNIVLSIGNTLALFERHGVKNIKDFVNPDVFDAIIAQALSGEKNPHNVSAIEAFSGKTLKWYQITAKATGIKYGDKEQKILVWFQDVNLRTIYQLRLKDLLRYSDTLITSLEKPLKPGTEYEHFAAFILKEYEAVYITRADKENNLEGYAFKDGLDGIIRSGTITVSNKSQAPINISRQQKQIISNDILDYPSYAEFLEANPFDPKVIDFIDTQIRNFITYNEADISIIAFNFRSRITSYEKQFFEIVVNIYRTMVTLVDQKKEIYETSRKRTEL